MPGARLQRDGAIARESAMKQRSVLQRIGTYLLGLVDEYYAMRRPWQYGSKDPQCGLRCEGDHCERADGPIS